MHCLDLDMLGEPGRRDDCSDTAKRVASQHQLAHVHFDVFHIFTEQFIVEGRDHESQLVYDGVHLFDSLIDLPSSF